jgi:hypothetical protein
VSLIHPAYKFAPDVARDELALYRLQIERGADWALACKAIAETGVEVLGVEEAQVIIAATGEQLEAVARVLDVALIENFRMFEKHNIYNDGSIDVDSGHSTHTSGSVLSDGGSNGVGKGTAPAAHLVFQSVENYAVVSLLYQIINGIPNGYYLTGLPTDLKQLFQQAYNAGRASTRIRGAAPLLGHIRLTHPTRMPSFGRTRIWSSPSPRAMKGLTVTLWLQAPGCSLPIQTCTG